MFLIPVSQLGIISEENSVNSLFDTVSILLTRMEISVGIRPILCTVISEECWGALTDARFEPKSQTIAELWGRISDCLPNLAREDMELYWRYSNEIFLPVKEFFTYQTFLNVCLNGQLILLVNDARNDVEETRKLLKILDADEAYREMVKNRNKYDVAHLVGPEAICQGSAEENNAQDNKEGRKEGREAVVREILTYALKKQQNKSVPEERFFTADCALKSALIECVQIGTFRSHFNCTSRRIISILGLSIAHNAAMVQYMNMKMKWAHIVALEPSI